jgi:transglycosylase-like protein with SLT domain
VSVAVATALTLSAGGGHGNGGSSGPASPGGASPAAGHGAGGQGAAVAGNPGNASAPGNTSADAAAMAVSLPMAGSRVIPDPGTTPGPWGKATAAPVSTTRVASAQPGTPPRQLVVPDIIAAGPGGISAAKVASISRLGDVRAVLPIDGARIAVNGQPVNVLAAPAAQLRSWTPPATAANTALWADFAAGDLITTASAASGLALQPGHGYPVTAAIQSRLTFGAQALLGVPGVDAIVNQAQAARLGLVKNVAVLINAPAARMDDLVAQVRQVIGASGGGQVVRLVPEVVSTQLPVDTKVPTGRPANYLMLYRESAAQYCPGMSWTVLAAIGEIESNNGQNMGPSSAGALGPMQFLPSTWAQWGTDGFGDTGPPNIMNPFDAVPSAARMLCADGAAQGGQSLRQAIFAYNHADWYVNEVLALAGEYAHEFG